MTSIDEKTNENFIMLPTVDFCFKELMKNPKVRKGFIAAVLGKEPGMIRQTTLIPTELHRESEDDKLGILDVLVELEDGSKMNMEMQVPYFEFWANRILFYVSRMYSQQIKKGESYDQIKPCIHVSILDFIHFPEDKDCCHKIALFRRKIRMRRELYAGCGSSVGRSGRSLSIWQRETSISERHTTN